MTRHFATSPFEARCWRCDEHIGDYRQAVKQNGKYIHRHCASGADDDAPRRR